MICHPDFNKLKLFKFYLALFTNGLLLLMFQDGVDDGPDLLAEDQNKVSPIFWPDTWWVDTRLILDDNKLGAKQDKNHHFSNMSSSNTQYLRTEKRMKYSVEVFVGIIMT